MVCLMFLFHFLFLSFSTFLSFAIAKEMEGACGGLGVVAENIASSLLLGICTDLSGFFSWN